MGRITLKESAFFRGEQRPAGFIMDGVSEAETTPYTVGEKPLGTYQEEKAEDLKSLPEDRLRATAEAQGIDTEGVSKTELLKKLKG